MHVYVEGPKTQNKTTQKEKLTYTIEKTKKLKTTKRNLCYEKE